MNGQGDAMSLQALGQLWTSITPRRSWQRTGIPPGRNRKDKRRMYRCILHVSQNIPDCICCFRYSKFAGKNSLCRTIVSSALKATATGVRGAGFLCPPSYCGFIFLQIRANVACKPLILRLLLSCL